MNIWTILSTQCVRHRSRRASGYAARISALTFFAYIDQHCRDAFIPIFNMDSMDNVQYHIKTLMLFTKSDVKTVVIPVVRHVVCTKSASTLLTEVLARRRLPSRQHRWEAYGDFPMSSSGSGSIFCKPMWPIKLPIQKKTRAINQTGPSQLHA